MSPKRRKPIILIVLGVLATAAVVTASVKLVTTFDEKMAYRSPMRQTAEMETPRDRALADRAARAEAAAAEPEEVIEISEDMTTEQMVDVGRRIFEGKGICYTCHSNTAIYPDLQGVATRAATRKPGYSAVDYLAESLYEPGAYIVEGFNPGMPAADKPPMGLTDAEILTVIAYLQTLGGEATVTMDTKTAYTGGDSPEPPS